MPVGSILQCGTIREKNSFTKKDTIICKGIAVILLYIYHLFYSADTLGMDKVEFWFLPENIWLSVASIWGRDRRTYYLFCYRYVRTILCVWDTSL